MSFLFYAEFLKPRSTELFHLGTSDTDRYLIAPESLLVGSDASTDEVNSFLSVKAQVNVKDKQKDMKISQLLMRQRSRVYNVVCDRLRTLNYLKNKYPAVPIY